MRHLPIFLDTRNARLIISGGGALAVAKLRTLVKTEAVLEIYAPQADEAIQDWVRSGRITHFQRRLDIRDLEGARVVFAASGIVSEDARVRTLARRLGITVNVADQMESSDFISPAVVDRDPVIVAISTTGTAPILARLIKSQIERLLSTQLGAVAQLAGRLRPAVRALLPARRREFWQWYFDGNGAASLNRLGFRSAQRELRTSLGEFAARPHRRGGVTLAGAGPGDPSLLTLAARDALESADVVLHDRLTDRRILDLARREALIVEVGKSVGRPSWSQAAINDAMVEHALAGRAVVRLKSGDPMMFGRADEEVDALETAGIGYEIIPGISAAAAAASRIGSSLTRRGRNSAVTFLTGHDVSGYAEHNWQALARSDAVFAIYMGVGAARFLQGRLLLHGRSPDTPVTVAENVARVDEVVVSGTLAELDELIAAQGISGPAIIFIGIAPRTKSAVRIAATARRATA